MTTRWLVLIESNTTGTGRLFARAAASQGYSPILLSRTPSRYKYAREDNLDVLEVDTQDERHLLAACHQLATTGELGGITSSSEYFIQTAATLASQLGLPGPNPESIRRCRDKLEQRLRLQTARIGVPAFEAAETELEALADAKTIGFPVVLKPISGSGSVGVKLCSDGDEVVSHAHSLLNESHNERGMPIQRRILVEEFAQGQEFSVEIFGGTIIGITRKHLGALPYFVETGHDFPAQLSTSDEELISQTAYRAIDALGLGWGPVHLELLVSKGEARIIEVNPRLAGGYIPELVRLAVGIEMIAETIRAATGKAVALKRLSNKHASIRFILSPSHGTLSCVGGLEAAMRLQGVVDVQLYCQPGERVYKYGDFRDRIGYIITLGDTHESAYKSAEEAQRVIEVFAEQIG